jgi:tRNA pseudouridine synthase 10
LKRGTLLPQNVSSASLVDSNEVQELVRPHAAGLCDHCLGRLVARLEPGVGNAERGRRIRAALATQAPTQCSLCEGLVHRITSWAGLCVEASEGYEHDSFLVGTIVFDAIRKRELAIFEDLKTRDTGLAAGLEAKTNSPPFPAAEWLKTEINREVGRLVEARTGKKVRFDKPDLTYRVDTRFDHVDLDVADLYAKGRYRKFARDLPQTRWPCRACGGLGCRQCGGTGKTYETSVEEIVAAPILKAARAEGEAFHGMGREDIDARSLGSGRPFVLELKRPKLRRLDWAALQDAVNREGAGRAEIEGLQPAKDADAARYKAADPDKTYQAVCKAEHAVDADRLRAALASLTGTELEQRTPQRVSHRRADLVRKRRVIALRLLEHAGDEFTIEIRAQSGTYIKEFVSGDEGRTQPNLSERIGNPSKVTALDVVDVDWQEPAEAETARPA